MHRIIFLIIFSIIAMFSRGAVSAKEFLARAQPGTTSFVVTWQKLGLPAADWSIREDVLFDPTHPNWQGVEGYLGSRGYEIRYPLHAHPSGFYQEIHTTINVFDHQPRLPDIAERVLVEALFIDGVPAIISHNTSDPANTIRIDFVLGHYQVNVKIKFSDLERAVPLLKDAARIVIGELR